LAIKIFEKIMQPKKNSKNSLLLHYALKPKITFFKNDFPSQNKKMDKNKCPFFLSDPNSFLEKK